MILVPATLASANLAEAVTAVAALAALGYAWYEIKETQRRADRELAYRWSERQLDPEFVKYQAKASDFLTITVTEADLRREEELRRWEKWNGMKKQKQGEILLYLNYLERVGGLFSSDRIDRGSAIHLFGLTAHTYWQRWNWFVWLVRNSAPGASETFKWWEELGLAWAEGHQRTQRRASSLLSRDEALQSGRSSTSMPRAQTRSYESLQIDLDGSAIELIAGRQHRGR